MPENEFEKQIQSRLDSLNLEPSAAVWQQVEYRIRKDKRRRWFIWIPLLAAGLGAGIWLVSNSGGGSLANNAAVETNAATPTAPTARPEKNSDQTSDNDQARSEENKLQQGVGENDNRTQKSDAKSQRVLANDERNNLHHHTRQQRPGITENGFIDNRDHATREKNQSSASQVSTTETGVDSVSGANPEALTTIPTTDSANLKKQLHDSALVMKVDDKKATTVVKKKAGRTWSFGLQGGVGVSAQSEALFGATQAAANDLYSGAVYPGGYPISTGSHQKVQLKSAFAFSFGGYAERRLSKSLSFELGLAYTQYGSNIQTGGLVNNTTFITVSTSRFMSVSNYYQAQASQSNGSSTYHNRYHYLELPVKLNIRLNPSGKTAFRWELGLVPAYLVATNALHYDEQQNIFYHDNSYFSKFQFGFNTALSVRIFAKSKHPMWLGPEYRSFMTNLTNQKSTNGNHLYYGGLKASYRLR